jgi:hypothetical protein
MHHTQTVAGIIGTVPEWKTSGTPTGEIYHETSIHLSYQSMNKETSFQNTRSSTRSSSSLPVHNTSIT